MNTRTFIVGNIKLPLNASSQEAFSVARKKLKSLEISDSDIKFNIYKQSIDARDKKDIKLVYSVACEVSDTSISSDKLKLCAITEINRTNPLDFELGTEKMSAPPLIVGSGPAGLFAALVLAEKGYNPILLERGGAVQERKAVVERFYKFGILDPETNIQFGAGGAGTFSDGKLVTRINDPLSDYVLSRFVEFGAPKEILYLARPHIGTDILSEVVDRMLSHITKLGAKVFFNTKYQRSIRQNGLNIAKTTNGDFQYSSLILATGHSARDIQEYLIDSGFAVESKNFSVGMRIEHLTESIDRAMFGDFAGHKKLGHAEYNLSHNTKARGVYTFCMCPGGEVVAAASEAGGVVVNGMSRHARDGKNSNCAVVCSVFREDYGATPKKAIEFQREIERRAFLAAGSDFSAPALTLGDFFENKSGTNFDKVLPTYMNSSMKVKSVHPNEYLPSFVTEGIKNALMAFDKKIHGFADKSAVLTGPETRTSSPIRVLRDNETRTAINNDSVYPCAEGAGYAGGITSAAIDGIKTAIAVMKKYKP